MRAMVPSTMPKKMSRSSSSWRVQVMRAASAERRMPSRAWIPRRSRAPPAARVSFRSCGTARSVTVTACLAVWCISSIYVAQSAVGSGRCATHGTLQACTHVHWLTNRAAERTTVVSLTRPPIKYELQVTRIGPGSHPLVSNITDHNRGLVINVQLGGHSSARGTP